jgi:hypothetical protein
MAGVATCTLLGSFENLVADENGKEEYIRQPLYFN